MNDIVELIIDTNEHTNEILVEKLDRQNLLLIPETLEVGDFFIPPYIIERKTVYDFISSSKNHGGLRIMEQLKKMKDHNIKGYKSILLIEGDESKAIAAKANMSKMTYGSVFNQFQGLKISVASDYGIPVIYTKDMNSTAYVLRRMAEKSVSPSDKAIPRRSSIPVSRPVIEKVKYLLEGIPFVGAKTSERIINSYKCLNDFFEECKNNPKMVINKIDRLNRKVPYEIRDILLEELE